MKPRLFFIAYLGFLFIILLGLNRCTLIGFGIGSAISTGKEGVTTVPGWEVYQVPQGSEVLFNLKDGTTITGKYLGMKRQPGKEYASRFKAAVTRLPENVFLPQIEDTVTVVLNNDKEYQGRFFGVGIRTFALQIERRYYLNLASLRELRWHPDKHIDAETLTSLIKSGTIPVYTLVNVDVDGQLHTIPWNDITTVQIFSHKRNYATVGLLVGAAVDALILLAATTSRESRPAKTDTTQFSCPFIYSFDGSKFVKETEVFDGAIFQKAQRTDLVHLENLRADHGECRLRLTNELPEIQFVDEVQLLAVDHPRGSQVYTTTDNRFLTVSSPVSPSRSTDLRGNDVQHFIEKGDDHFWVSHPYALSPRDEKQLRDGLILEFPRDDNSTGMKLILRLQNTYWASYLQGKVLSLQGRDLPKWYRLMNTSPEARQRFQQAMLREGMLHVQLWQSNQWQSVGYIWEVGPNIPRYQALKLDISGVTGDVVQIRLESTSGLWMIDQVFADFSEDLPVEVGEIHPKTALDHNGNDVLALLREEDHQYYRMPDKSDWAELRFSVPPVKENFSRTYFVKSSGYYHILVPARGEPRHQLVAQFMEQPGAVGRYSRALLNHYLSGIISPGGER